MRTDEIRIAELLTYYLASRVPSNDVSYSSGEDPPDAYIHVGEVTYPLEITSTEVPRDSVFGERKVRERTYEESHRRLLKEVEEEAKGDKSLIGKYAISFSKPIASQEFSTYRSIFKEELHKLLRNLHSAPVGFDTTIEHDFSELAWIYKLSDQGSKLYEVFQDGAWTESPEFIDFFRSLINKAIDNKLEVLSKVLDPSQCILAIRNTYGLADPQTLLALRSRIAEEKPLFHSVIIVFGNHLFVLQSIRPEWIAGDA